MTINGVRHRCVQSVKAMVKFWSILRMRLAYSSSNLRPERLYQPLDELGSARSKYLRRKIVGEMDWSLARNNPHLAQFLRVAVARWYN